MHHSLTSGLFFSFCNIMLSALHMQFPPEKFVETLKLMEHRYGAKAFVMSKDCSLLASGTYYLTEVDSMYRRFYAKKSGDGDNTDPMSTC